MCAPGAALIHWPTTPLAGFFRWFAQCLAVEREAVRGVHEAVEDGISDCGIDDRLVPMVDGELGGHDCRAAAVAIVNDFEQVAALLGGQWCQAPIVEDQKLDTGMAFEEAYILTDAEPQFMGQPQPSRIFLIDILIPASE
jgi:hypothetical protein